MKTTNLCQQLLGTDQLLIHQLEIDRDRISLLVESKMVKWGCPECGKISLQIHSRYARHPIDLAWADFKVVLDLQVKRFFCHNAKCSKRLRIDAALAAA